jgi:hypothetical protein
VPDDGRHGSCPSIVQGRSPSRWSLSLMANDVKSEQHSH